MIPVGMWAGQGFDGETISCGIDTTFTGDAAFPTNTHITLGSFIGLVDLEFVTSGVPDKFEVWIGGVKVIDTGYIGDVSYQSDLDDELTLRGVPTETITQRLGDGVTLDDDWNHPTKREKAQFYKSTTSSVATVKIFSPLGGGWKFSLSCPDNELQLTFLDELAGYENLTLTGTSGSLSITG